MELLTYEARKCGDLLRRDRGPCSDIGGDLAEGRKRKIALVLQPGKAMLELVIKFNNTRFNGLVEPAYASANGIDLGLEFLAASDNGVILCSDWDLFTTHSCFLRNMRQTG